MIPWIPTVWFCLILSSTLAQTDSPLQSFVLTSEETVDTFIYARPSRSFRQLISKISAHERLFERYSSKSKVLADNGLGRLIMSSNDAILFAREMENRKLFFTNFYFEDSEDLSEVKYFFYDGFQKLRLEYLTQVHELTKKMGLPIQAEETANDFNHQWYEKDKSIRLTFGQEKVSKEGVISLFIRKLDEKEKESENMVSNDPKPDKPSKTMMINEDRGRGSKKVFIAPSAESVVKQTYEFNEKFQVMQSTSLRADGKDGSLILRRLSEGEIVKILGSSNDYWVNVLASDDLEGWVKKALIRKADSPPQ